MLQPSVLLAREPLPSATREWLTIEKYAPCKDALTLMANNGVLCLPVVQSDMDAAIFSSIDVVDIVQYITRLHGDCSGLPPAFRYSHEWVGWNHATVQHALEEKRRDVVLIEQKASLLDAARLFIETPAHRHRAFIVNGARRFVNIVSQSDVIDALHAHIDELDETLMSRPISQV